MEINQISQSFLSLAQETRLQGFKILSEYGRDGLPAGEISRRLGIPHNTLSFHLNNLKSAGLVTCRREGRSMIYAADTEAIESLIGFLQDNCCIHESAPASTCKPTKGIP